MKKELSEFYKPTDAEFKKLWQDCIFVFDANVLLNLYRYPQKTTKKLLSIITKVKDRIWIPNQAAFEYQKNRLEVINKQEKAYEDVMSLFQGTYSQLEKNIETYTQHPFLNCKQIIKKISASHKTLENEIKKISQKHPDWKNKDDIRDSLDKLFKDKVGEVYSSEELCEIYKEGDIRYQKEIPPGYKDKKKDSKDLTEIRKYGDLIIWYQLIKKAKSENKPIIFITDDQKDDWWWEVLGEKVGPRFELIKEFKDKTKNSFYMYRSAQFISYAGEHLSLKVTQEVIDDIKKVQENNNDKDELVGGILDTNISSSTVLVGTAELHASILNPTIKTSTQESLSFEAETSDSGNQEIT